MRRLQFPNWLVGLWFAGVLAIYQGQPGDAASHHLPVENHHSLFKPMDAALHYWSFGGSTVAATSFLRLTPATQSRTGWLYNDYSLRSNDWELQLVVNIRSDYHIGGDGMAIWFLDRAFNEQKNEDPNWMVGPVCGLRDDFKGFGVILDTYDNDSNRKNPTVLVVSNDGTKKDWNHDQDFEPDRIKTGHTGSGTTELPTSCTLDYRNRKSIYLMLRYQKGVLHVYTDIDNSEGNKRPDYGLCLAVALNIDTSDTHNMAFTAHTGAVADTHDLESIVMRYLDDDDPVIDDWTLSRQSSFRKVPWQKCVYWCFAILPATYLVWLTYSEYSAYKTNIERNTALLCLKVNSSRATSSKLCVGLYFFLVFTGAYWPVILYTPKFLIHAWEYMTNFRLEPQVLAKLEARKGGSTMVQYFYLELASSLLADLYMIKTLCGF